jgi:hypothetical protein
VVFVTFVAVAPGVAAIVKISRSPSRSVSKAILVPSGDQAGWTS